MTIRLRYKVSLGEQQMLSAVFSGRPPSPSLPPSLPASRSLSLSLSLSPASSLHVLGASTPGANARARYPVSQLTEVTKPIVGSPLLA